MYTHETDYVKNMKINGYQKIKDFQQTNGNELLTKFSDYDNQRTRIDIKCKCGNVFNIIAGAGKYQSCCPSCSNIKSSNATRTSKQDIIDALKRISKKQDDNYDWIDGEHKNRFSKLTIVDKFGYRYLCTATSLLHSDKITTYKFHAKNPYTIDNIKIWMKNNTPNYKLLSNKYINVKSYLVFECPEGHIFKMNFDNFQQGQRCSECNLSKGAREVLYALRNNDLNCIVEYRFDDCRGKRNPLPFDFAIFDDNFVDLKWLCEFDGELHYQESRFSSDEKKNKKKLTERKRYDAIKTKYCIDNNIPLLRIPYWERDNGSVENVIDDFLNQLDSNISQSH